MTTTGAWPDVRLSALGDGIVLLELDSQNRPMNVMTPELIEQLGNVVTRIADDPAIQGVVIASGKTSGFMAGADLKGMTSMFGQDIPEHGIDGVSKRRLVFEKNFRFNQVLRALETSGKPFVCAIDGVALGGGCELALACHARIATNRRGVRLGLPEVSVGLMPGAGGTQRLVRTIDLARALELLLTGAMIDADEALAQGLIDAVVAPDQLVSAAATLARKRSPRQLWDRSDPATTEVDEPSEIIAKARARVSAGAQRHYRAPSAIVDAVATGLRSTFDEAIRVETEAFVDLVLHPQSATMIDTLFVAKQAAIRRGGERATRVAVDMSSPAALMLANRLRNAGAEVVATDDATGAITITPDAAGRAGALVVAAPDGRALHIVLSSVGRDGEIAEILDPVADRVPSVALAVAARLRAIPIVERVIDTGYVARCAQLHASAIMVAKRGGWTESAVAAALEDFGLPEASTPTGELPASLTQPPAPGSADALGIWLLDLQTAHAESCLAEGLISSESDANLAAVYGWGMPAFTGGPFGWRLQRAAS